MYPTGIKEAKTKCIVWFKDGNVRTFYSLDKVHRAANPNEDLGIRRLDKMLMKKFKGRWIRAVIYENQEGGSPLFFYRNGKRES